MEIYLFKENIIQGDASGSRETENKTFKSFFFFKEFGSQSSLVVV